MFEVFEHTADLGLRIQAATLNELFADAARGLFSLIVANLDEVVPVQEHVMEIQTDRLDELLFDWLNELLFCFESRRLLLSHFDVDVRPPQLRAVCRGEIMQLARHEMDHEIKAITYHQLSVKQLDGSWVAEIIVDI